MVAEAATGKSKHAQMQALARAKAKKDREEAAARAAAGGEKGQSSTLGGSSSPVSKPTASPEVGEKVEWEQ